jgi:hypothetical protein
LSDARWGNCLQNILFHPVVSTAAESSGSRTGIAISGTGKPAKNECDQKAKHSNEAREVVILDG